MSADPVTESPDASASPANPSPPESHRSLIGGVGRWRPAQLTAALIVLAMVSGGAGSVATLLALRYSSQHSGVPGQVGLSAGNSVAKLIDQASPAVVSLVSGEGRQPVGSGFLISGDGYIVTGLAVIANTQGLAAVLRGESKARDARVVDYDCQAQVAVVKIDGVSSLPFLSFGDSGSLRAGESLIALGGPMSSRHQASLGIVSAIHGLSTSSGGEGAIADTIQTDAAIGSDNSGGPLLNLAGQVVGMSLYLASTGSGLGVSAGWVQLDAEQIVHNGRLVLPGVGLNGLDLGSSEAAVRGLVAGTLITDVTAGGPAERAGLRTGDVITQINDVKLDPAHPLGQVVRSGLAPAQRVTVTISRGGSQTQLELTLGPGEHPSC